jgi:formylglycine-generating enzyme required for sulfatase activity
MVYVPAGTFWMGSSDEDIDAVLAGCDGCEREWFTGEQPQHEVYLDAFWIDRTEVTNAMFARFVADTGYETVAEEKGSSWVFKASSKEWEDTAGADWQHPYGPSTSLEGLDEYPVMHVNWDDARTYCQWANKRLPTEAEWEKAARGTDKRIYPWGDILDGSLLNFCDVNCELDWQDGAWYDGYAHTAPVGSYEDGASPYGVLDMAGNVWEWVADWYDSDYYDRSPERNPQGASSGEGRVLRGGAWGDDKRLVRVALRNYGQAIGSDVTGFRCAYSDSEPPLSMETPPLTNTPLPGTGSPQPPTPAPISQGSAIKIWDKDGSVMVYVPAGTFWMGSSDEDIDALLAECGGCKREWYASEQPQHEVYLDAFWIDRTEVTNAQYAVFLNEQGYQREMGDSWLDLGDDLCLVERVDGEYRPKDEYADHPVVTVTWYGAQAYCAWAGKRLPSEAEWEKAARGNDRRLYPWGNSALDCSKAQSSKCLGRTVAVGIKTAGASPYGVLDMAGNAWEWVADWYDEGYYASSPESNPVGPDNAPCKSLRGGSWDDSWSHARAANREELFPDATYDDLGFRCATGSPGE